MAGRFLNLKTGIIAVFVLIFTIVLVWLFVESSKPLPGTKTADEGRGHVPLGEEVKYVTNPPTSGKHYEDWTRSGVYSSPKDDRNLVHSLEHGYVIMSYNCDHTEVSSSKFLVSPVYAHEEDSQASDSVLIASASAILSQNFQSDSCQKLVKQLIEIYNKKGKTRLIIIPRPSLDTRVALTAWSYIDKFDKFDKARIEKFIDAHLNQGPEKTME